MTFTMVKPRAEMDEAIGLFAGTLSHKNCVKFLEMDRNIQERIIYQAFKKGIITYKARRQHEELH